MSWDAAFPSLSSAVAAASPGDEIHIAQGEYAESSIHLKPNIALIGGYPANAQPGTTRDPSLFPTRFDGQNEKASLFFVNQTNRIDGLVIENYHDSPIQCANASLVLQNCVLKRNRSEQTGGAMAITNSTAVILGCAFSFNHSRLDGGAVYARDSTLRIENAVFARNQTVNIMGKGGGLAVERGSLQMQNARFERNASYLAGGVFLGETFPAVIFSSTILHNVSVKEGGGIVAKRISRFQLKGCAVSFNMSRELGAGLHLNEGANALVDRCELESNVILRNNGVGSGALFMGHQNATIIRSQFNKNLAQPFMSKGGGIYLEESTLAVAFSSFWKNRAMTGAAIAGRINAEAEMRNCSIWNDSRHPSTAIDCIQIGDAMELYHQSPSTAALQNTLVWNQWLPSIHPMQIAGNNIIGDHIYGDIPPIQSVDDLGLRSPEAGDLRLRGNSPLIDAGSGTDTVLDLQPIDGDRDGQAVWDIGAFEYDPNRAAPQ